jgi:hypothetical protein
MAIVADTGWVVLGVGLGIGASLGLSQAPVAIDGLDPLSLASLTVFALLAQSLGDRPLATAL